MQDALRAYVELALGVTEASRRKAEEVARKLVGQGAARAAQLQGLVEELVTTSRTNREHLVRLVRFEVDRALAAVGLATAEEVAELKARVEELERQLQRTSAQAAAAEATAADAAAAADTGAPATDEAPGAVTAPATRPAAKKVVKKAVKKAVRPVKKASPQTPPEAS